MKLSLALPATALLAAAIATPTAVPMPGGTGGIGFDDLQFSKPLHRVLVPAGGTGRLNLLDPKSQSIDSIEGFTTKEFHGGGHGQGTTSADTNGKLVFATDRGGPAVVVVDPKSKTIVAKASLAGGPDYVRWVAPTSEVWVTEPRRKSIEVFRLEEGPAPKLVPSGTITVEDGPESLVIDATRGCAYTNTWQDATLVVSLTTREVVGKFPNGCEGARGLALDEPGGLLFVGCEEGKASVLDVAHGGKKLGTVKAGAGVDIIAYDPALRHLYVPGGDAATMTVAGVSAKGSLKALDTVPTAKDAHCVAADDLGNVYVCDPERGRLLVFRDSIPAAR